MGLDLCLLLRYVCFYAIDVVFSYISIGPPTRACSSLRTSETGCGKTTVVQLLGILLERHLHVVNCHASTETSDLLGGLLQLGLQLLDFLLQRELFIL